MLIISVFLVLAMPLTVVCLECYSCGNTTNLASCNTLKVCQSGESCPPKSGSSTLVGRSVISAQDDHCSECCDSGLCNRQLCQNYDSACVDKTDCSATGSFTNICDHVDHVKNVCKRFCGLCSLADGGWSQWSTWSACDSTCQSGTVTRTRMCNNPAPTNGGATCVGNKHETESCSSNRDCPVHGGWSQWSSWGSCSATCDIGLQLRDRSCNLPYPAYGGHYCSGNNHNDRLCLPGPCADGDWSAWGSWGSCSKSCGGGLRSRLRNCDNPAPSVMGQYCTGHGLESAICNMASCQGPVVFFARDLSTLSPHENTTLIFTNVTINVGHAYNNATGVFTAPVNGTYTFSVKFCNEYQSISKVGLYINDVEFQNLYNLPDVRFSCRAFSESVLLKEFDRVYIKTHIVTTSPHDKLVFYTGKSKINTFSGALVMRI